jgi:hypothetical protein
MDEADNRMEADGKGLFIIRNGQKVAYFFGYEAFAPTATQSPSYIAGSHDRRTLCTI